MIKTKNRGRHTDGQTGRQNGGTGGMAGERLWSGDILQIMRWEQSERRELDGERCNTCSKIRIVCDSGKSLTGNGSVTAQWSLIRSWMAENLNNIIVVNIMKLNIWLTLMIWPGECFTFHSLAFSDQLRKYQRSECSPKKNTSTIGFPNRDHTHMKCRITDLSSEQHLTKQRIIWTLQPSMTSDSVWHLNLWKSQRAPPWSQLYLL